MSIWQLLREVLRLRPHHDKPKSTSRYPVLSRRLGRLFRVKSRSKQRSTGYGTNERNQSYPAEDGESPPIIPFLAFDTKSTFWPSLPDVTSATLAPAQIIGRSPNTQDDETTNVPTTGATLSPQFSHPRFRASLVDVTTDSLPLAGSISHISNTEDGSPSNVPVTGATASLRLAQLTPEPGLSPPSIRPFRFLSLPTVSLDDLSFADFINRAPDNEDDDSGKVLTAEATISLDSSLLDVSSDSRSAAGPTSHIFVAEDTNASNTSVTGTIASPQLALSAFDALLFLPRSFSTARLDDPAPAEFIEHPPDNEDVEDGKAANIPLARPPISPQLGQLTTERGASPTNIITQRASTVSLNDLAPADIGHTRNNEARDAGNVPAVETTVPPQTGAYVDADPTDDALLKTI